MTKTTFAMISAVGLLGLSGVAFAQDDKLDTVTFYKECLKLLREANGHLLTIAKNTVPVAPQPAPTPPPQVISPLVIEFSTSDPHLDLITCDPGLALPNPKSCPVEADNFCRKIGYQRAVHVRAAPQNGAFVKTILGLVCTSSPPL